MSPSEKGGKLLTVASEVVITGGRSSTPPVDPKAPDSQPNSPLTGLAG